VTKGLLSNAVAHIGGQARQMPCDVTFTDAFTPALSR